LGEDDHLRIFGKCDRCGTVVEKKNLRQWYLKITAYADKLLAGLKNDLSQWPEQVKLQQENWIGKSTGAEIEFQFVIPDATKGDVESMSSGSHIKYGMTQTGVKVFTTRPDTIFGATFLVVSPELAQEWITGGWAASKQVKTYIDKALTKDEQDRTAEKKDKTGVDTGLTAENPATKKQIPIFVADYVLGNYGTGAIMAVPAHDDRDLDFATTFKLPVVEVIKDDILVNSSQKYNGKKADEVMTIMAKDFGKPKVHYKLRDWVFSRQRYWGEPIPVIHCDKCGIVAVPDKDLPVLLPKVKKYEPTGTGESPLAAIDSWVNVKCPQCKAPAKRETNTMPQWAGSSWYYLRYVDPKNNKEFASKDALKYWLQVDTYFGGMEHTTLHLLYSRFWNLFLYDQKLVPVKEPYKKRVPHGIILAHDGEKMSKSKGNVVNPDDIIEQYGTDTLRMYEMFLGPHDAQVAWNDKGVIGVRRFLERVWLLGNDMASNQAKTKTTDNAEKSLNRLIKKITEDIEATRFNTAVSAFMEFLNSVKGESLSTAGFIDFLKLLYPFAPHISEELYQMLGGKKSLQLETWPKFDPKKIIDTTVDIIIQVNGKVRDKISVPIDTKEESVKALVLESEKIKTAIGNSSPKRIIVIKNKLVNIVI
jgi:leucyl-tRNA synthetase